MKNKIKELVLTFLKDHGKNVIDFVDIERMLEENDIDFKGDSAIHTRNYGPIYFWLGMSQDFADAIIELKNEGKIEFKACDIGIYLINGKILKLPLVEKKQTFKNPHWLPVRVKLK